MAIESFDDVLFGVLSSSGDVVTPNGCVTCIGTYVSTILGNPGC